MNSILTDTAKEAKLFNITEYHADGFNNVVYNKDIQFADMDEAILWVKANLIPEEWQPELDENGDDQYLTLSYVLSKEDLEELSGEPMTDEDYEKSEAVVYSWNISDEGDVETNDKADDS